jgi:hypothetical protein
MDRPTGIYASSLSRRDLARRRARLHSSLMVRAANWLGGGAVVAVAVVLAGRLA